MLIGRSFAFFSDRSAAALRLMAVLGPPGGVGDDGRAVVLPVEGEERGGGEEGGGEAWLAERRG